jgi:hypothetical protein
LGLPITMLTCADEVLGTHRVTRVLHFL